MYVRVQTNCLDFEGREVKVKVATRSDVQNFGSPYYLHGLKDHSVIEYDA